MLDIKNERWTDPVLTERKILQTDRPTHSPGGDRAVYLSQFMDRFVWTRFAPINHINTIRLRVRHMILHKTAESRQVGRDAGYSHHRTLR